LKANKKLHKNVLGSSNFLQTDGNWKRRNFLRGLTVKYYWHRETIKDLKPSL